MADNDEYVVNGLIFPPLLIDLIRAGKWKHPGDERLREIIPFLDDPVDFLSIEQMRRESRGSYLGDDAKNDFMREARGAKCDFPVELPWLDKDKSFFIAVNREIGADVAIALDYRSSTHDPRVLASDWRGRDGQYWREVTSTFSAFVDLLGIKPD